MRARGSISKSARRMLATNPEIRWKEMVQRVMEDTGAQFESVRSVVGRIRKNAREAACERQELQS